MILLPQVALAQDGLSWDGNWVLMAQDGSTRLRALRISGGSILWLDQDEEGVALVRGWWTPQGEAEGVSQFFLEISSQVIEGAPSFAEISTEILVRPLGPDGAELIVPGDLGFTAVMQRTQCDLSLLYRDIGETPPDGCGWLEIRGVGYDGLSGDCAWSADWEANWDALTADAGPMRCVVTAPASFVE
jgi:hypothetical protein